MSINNQVVSNAQYKIGTASTTAILADSSLTPTADADDRQGWAFIKTLSNADKFNIYFYGQGSLPIRLGDIHSVFANVAINSHVDNSSKPHINIYTKMTGSGDAGAFYHSKLTFTIPNNYNIQLGETITLMTHREESLGYGYRNCVLRDVVVDGDGAESEEILYMTLHSDSAAVAGLNMIISDLGFSTNQLGENRISRRIKLIA